MTKIIIEGKEVNLNNTEEDVIKFLESKGAKKIDQKIYRKTIEQLSLDPLTIGIAVVGIGGYIWYSVAKENMTEIKKAIKL